MSCACFSQLLPLCLLPACSLTERFRLPSLLLLSEMQFYCMPLGLTGSRDFALAGPCQPLISIFAHFQVEMAVTITSTQTDVTVTLANYRMTLLTPTSPQENVTCTAVALPSKETIYPTQWFTGFWLQSPSGHDRPAAETKAGPRCKSCSRNAAPAQSKALCPRSIRLVHGLSYHFPAKTPPHGQAFS